MLERHTSRPGIAPVVLAFSVLWAACNTQHVDVPDLTGPASPTVTPPAGVIIAPAPKPSASPSPAPSPAASPNPSPDPNPTPGPTPAPAASCKLPPGNGNGDDCDRTNPSFLDDVESALDELASTHPEIFDKKDAKCPNCYKVKDPLEYTSRMVQILQSKGLCAKYDGEELAVKNTNDFNDQYDILTADLYIRRNDGSYRSTCRPAVF